ncbi:hypothetical protein ACFW4K_07300 [Nocardiopsis alba]|uniref:hypothetical protein n=1 Tax=Nocardiopsis alba TaxID=53437 RepID=UPI00366B89CF
MKVGYVDFNFFGQSVRMSGEEHDLVDARFFYSGHLAMSDADAPDLLVDISCCDLPQRGFFTSLLAKDRLRKRIRLSARTEEGWGEPRTTEFTSWSGVSSPLPPFRDSSLWRRVATYSGTTMTMPDGRGMVITGNNYVGKTATSLQLHERGYGLISDSVVVLDSESGELLPYLSPIGYRRENLRRNYDWISTVPHRETISPDTGLVVLVRPEDALPEQSERDPVPFDVLVHLRRAGGESSSTVLSTPDIGWYTGVPRNVVDSLVPQNIHAVTVPENAPPDEVADQIEKAMAS